MGLVKKRAETRPQAAVDKDRGVEEAFGEDRDGGELVAGLVGMVEYNDLRGRWDWLRRQDVAEANWDWAVAGRAATALRGRRRRCGGCGDRF